MLPEATSFDLAELSFQAGVSPRTVRYYIQQGLLPSPEARGPGAHYGPEHLDRIRLIKRLQHEHLPLAEIRRRLDDLDPDEIRRLLKGEPGKPPGDAKEYIRRVLAGGQGKMVEERALFAPLGQLRESGGAWEAAPTSKAGARSQWDRVALTPDVELHVRRPLSREQNKQVERLMEAARHIFEEESP